MHGKRELYVEAGMRSGSFIHTLLQFVEGYVFAVCLQRRKGEIVCGPARACTVCVCVRGVHCVCVRARRALCVCVC